MSLYDLLDTLSQGGLMNPVLLGQKLAAARRSRSLSQEDAARHLGVSRPTMVAMEKGIRPPKPAEIVALAALYGRSVHDLVSARESVPVFAPQFRVTQAANITDEAIAAAVAEFKRVCEDYLLIESLVNAPMPRPNYPVEYSTAGLSPQAAAEEIAAMERSRLNLGQGPALDPLELLENEAGLRVFALPLGEFRIAGMFAYADPMGGCVLVNGSHPVTRRNWSAAHEYAHFLTDRYSSDLTVLVEYERRPHGEQFADAFAAAFLMPAGVLRQRFRKIVQSRGDFTVADLCLLADQYAVSVEAMTRRLEALGCVQKGMWDRLVARGVDGRREQAYLGIESRPEGFRGVRLPERYRRLAVQAYEEEKITESALARLLRCSRVEAREAVESLTRARDVDRAGRPYQLDLDCGEAVELAPAERG
jgi:Zn-dependent peptidase ImmA (M78 family)/DNA-binding XRE family transcriptional regulator